MNTGESARTLAEQSCIFLKVRGYVGYINTKHTLWIWDGHPCIYGFIDGYIDMGWLRLVGSIKLQVSFAEYSLFYRALLQKRPIILSILRT